MHLFAPLTGHHALTTANFDIIRRRAQFRTMTTGTFDKYIDMSDGGLRLRIEAAKAAMHDARIGS